MKERLVVFDVMRSLAIFIILFHHLPNYSFDFYDLSSLGIDLDLSAINELNRYFGLSLFIFISGYLLNIKKVNFLNFREKAAFLYKKIVRIFPLYYVAIVTFCYMFNIDEPLRIGVHVLGLQSLLHSNEINSFPTLWFIGTLLIYYFVFMVLKTGNLNRNLRLLIVAVFPFITLFSNRVLEIVDPRVTLYYWIFLFGVYCAETKLLEKSFFKRTTVARMIAFGLVAAFCLFVEEKYGIEKLDPLKELALLNVLMFCFVPLVYDLCSAWAAKLESNKALHTIAYSSYGMYLFHRPVWFILEQAIGDVLDVNNQWVAILILVVLGIPLITGFAYLMQYFYDKYCLPYLLNNRFLNWEPEPRAR